MRYILNAIYNTWCKFLKSYLSNRKQIWKSLRIIYTCIPKRASQSLQRCCNIILNFVHTLCYFKMRTLASNKLLVI